MKMITKNLYICRLDDLLKYAKNFNYVYNFSEKRNIDSDTLDYSDSAAAIYRVTFTYEGFKILSDGQATTEAEILQAEEFANTPTADDGFVEVDDFAEYEVDDADNIDGLQTTGNVTSNQAPLKEVPVKDSNPDNLQVFKGKLKTGEKIRNINGKSYVVPAPNSSNMRL